MKNIVLAVTVLSFTLSSCKIFRPNEIFRIDKNFPVSEFKPSEKEYRIRAFDKFTLQIFTNDGLKLVETTNTIPYTTQGALNYLVEFDGTAKLPTLGRTNLAGLTIREAEVQLEQLYSQFYQKPFVKINIINRRIIIFKSGASSGTVIPIENENFTLIEALAQSGGIDDNSKSFKIKLIRGDLNNPEVYIYNIRSINDMGKANFVLQANDIIYVEARPRYASRVLQEISPYLSLLSTTLLIFALF